MLAAVGRAARPPGTTLYGIYVVAIAVSLMGNLLVRLGAEGGWLPAWGRASLATATALPLLATAVLFWKLLRSELDEMLQRIVLEGMAFGLVVYLPLAALYVKLRTAGVWTPRLDPPDLLMIPALLVAAGIILSWRRHA